MCYACKNICYLSVVVVDPVGSSRDATYLLCTDCAVAELLLSGLRLQSRWTLACRLTDEELEAIVSVAASKLPADHADAPPAQPETPAEAARVDVGVSA
jgi:hypothetical protein